MLTVKLKLTLLRIKLFANLIFLCIINFLSFCLKNKRCISIALLIVYSLFHHSTYCRGQSNPDLNLLLRNITDNVDPLKLNTENKFVVANYTCRDHLSSSHTIYHSKTDKLDKTANAYHTIKDVFIPANSEMPYNFKLPLYLNNSENYYLLIVDDDNGKVIDAIQIKQTNEGNVIFINSNLNYAVYGLLAFIIACLLLYIFKKPVNPIELKKEEMTSDIDQLILKDKIETALEKLHACVKHNDEKLRSEILLLSNSLYRCNRDRLNGLMPEEDYSIRKNKIVSRAIDISCELQLA